MLSPGMAGTVKLRSEEHTSELQSHVNLVCRLLLEKKKSLDRKSTRLNSSHPSISYAVFCLKKKKDPPDSAKPRAWWHWLNGNVTKEGITADLEWMKRVGIAGMQMFDGSLGVPQFVDKRLVWMTPDWKDAFRNAAAEADRLGLEMAMAASGGWSETAGPWVKPEEGMKKVVWSETRMQGTRKWSGV